MIERTTVRLPSALLHRARRQAAAEGTTLTALIEDGLRVVVGRSPRPRKGDRKPIPVSTATGGTFPGIDITDGSAIQEMEDLEYVERMKHFR
jgi:hypothetical protein